MNPAPPSNTLRDWILPVVATLSLIAAAGLSAQETSKKSENPPVNVNKKGLALGGYDPVAYFEEGGGKAQKGKKDLTAEHGGATYRFATEANRALFLKKSEDFVPAYGGFCAYAMVDGKQVEIDPKRYEIHDGRLFLFYRDWFTDTLKPWQKKRGEFLPKADAQWQKLAGEEDKDK